MNQTQSFIEDVYDSLMGELIIPVPEVEYAFAKDSKCDLLYRDVMDAYERLRIRLGKEDEDDDCEIIINSLLNISRILGLKMFEYGAKFGIHDEYPADLLPKVYFFVDAKFDPKFVFGESTPTCIDAEEIASLTVEKGFDVMKIMHEATAEELLRFGIK